MASSECNFDLCYVCNENWIEENPKPTSMIIDPLTPGALDVLKQFIEQKPKEKKGWPIEIINSCPCNRSLKMHENCCNEFMKALPKCELCDTTFTADHKRKKYWPLGKILSEQQIKDGRIYGYSKKYYENGVMSGEGDIDYEQKTGTWKEYSESGCLKQEEYYISSETLKYIRSYYDSKNPNEPPQLECEGQYNEHGEHTGIWKYYDKEGNFTRKVNYDSKFERDMELLRCMTLGPHPEKVTKEQHLMFEEFLKVARLANDNKLPIGDHNKCPIM